MSTIVISGASGLVGSALAESLEASGHHVKRLVRRPATDAEREVFWKPSEGRIDADGLQGADAVVHLAGESVASGRWTEPVKRRIVDSRIQGTRLLSQTLAGLEPKPRVLVSASAIGFYGNRPGEVVDEQSPPGAGFLAETSIQWEAETRPAWEAGIRVVQMRIGMVLSPAGGALAKMLPIFNLCLGGKLGNGQQMVSWISLPDLVRALEFAVEQDSLHGAVNATAPNPVSNAEFTRCLAGAIGRCACLPAPTFGLRMLYGQMADEVLLAGAHVTPTRLLAAGFEFETPVLEPALRKVLDQ